MNLLTKIFKRPVQVGSIILMGLCMHVLLPKDPSAEQWVAYCLSFLAYLINGMDNYREGMERGIGIMEELS